jgi:hypothetical protein
LSARVFEILALALGEGLWIDLPLGGRAETWMAIIGILLSKPGMGEMKLSKACIRMNKI